MLFEFRSVSFVRHPVWHKITPIVMVYHNNWGAVQNEVGMFLFNSISIFLLYVLLYVLHKALSIYYNHQIKIFAFI